MTRNAGNTTMLTGASGAGVMPVAGRMASMFLAVFSWVTTSTVAGNSTLPLTWSPCVWVLMIILIGRRARSVFS
jgi:hypothetical protein